MAASRRRRHCFTSQRDEPAGDERWELEDGHEFSRGISMIFANRLHSPPISRPAGTRVGEVGVHIAMPVRGQLGQKSRHEGNLLIRLAAPSMLARCAVQALDRMKWLGMSSRLWAAVAAVALHLMPGALVPAIAQPSLCEAGRQANGWRALPGAPLARQVEQTSNHFGISRTDEFAWLRADGWQEAVRDPKKLPQAIRRHLDAEAKYARRSLATTRSLQAQLAAQMRGRIAPSTSSPPAPDGPWTYFERFTAGREHPVLWRRPRSGGPATRLLDVNRLARRASSFDFAGARHSPDHRLLAYAIDTSGTEDFTIRVRNLATGRDLPDAIAMAEDVPVWAADSRSFFYARRDDGRALTILRHTLGTGADTDAIVYRETDPAFLLTLSRTTSGKFVVITAADARTEEVRVVDTAEPHEAPRLIAERREGERHAVEHAGDRLIIRTSAGATDFRIVEAPITAPQRANWREVVAHLADTTIRDVQVTARHMVRIERRDGRDRIVVRRLANGTEQTISFPDEPYFIALKESLEFDTDTLRFTHETLRHPRRTIDLDMSTGRQRIRKIEAIPSGHDPRRYVTERRHATAHDGERVPISLLYRKGLRRDGRAPLFLHGYGAYGDASDAIFDSNALSLVDRGFVYAIAHVRGGNELGERWRDGGMLAAKSNSFRDFLAVGETLAAEGYTSRGRIVANGRSAGGLLVAASVNMRPDLFMGVIAQAPFVDALNTMLDPSLPLTPNEWNEWGNPIQDRGAFETIQAYSPYDNVRAQAYPAILASISLTDPRVTYWEPAKWVARLRARKTDRNPVLLVIEPQVGHEGPSGRFEKLKDKARDYAFALKLARSVPCAVPRPKLVAR